MHLSPTEAGRPTQVSDSRQAGAERRGAPSAEAGTQLSQAESEGRGGQPAERRREERGTLVQRSDGKSTKERTVNHGVKKGDKRSGGRWPEN